MNRRQVFGILGPLAGLHHFSPVFAADGAAEGKQPDVEINLKAGPGDVSLLPGPPTKVWRFTAELLKGPPETLQVIEGSYSGPVIRLQRGQRVRIRFRNELGEPSIVHWHGLDVPEAADGHPRYAVGLGQEYVYNFEVTNRAGTYWFHPHPHMRTGAQVYQGLAGLIIVSDDEERALRLPDGSAELLWVLQDRRFDTGNQFVYAGASGGGERGQGPGRGRGRGRGMGGMMETMNGWLGDRMLVSGRVDAKFDVDRRAYRIRLLNGSNARIYKLAWSDGTPMTVIGTDGGLLEKPRALPCLTLAPGQRAEVLLDLSGYAGAEPLKLVSLPYSADDAGGVGMMENNIPKPQGADLTLATLNVSQTKGPGFPLPEKLTADTFKPSPEAPLRKVPLVFMRMTWFIDERTFDMQDVAESETVKAGAVHLWEFENQENPMGMAMAHPMHIHGTQFRVVSRSGGGENALREGIHDAGWQDTVLVLPGEKVRVQIKFSTHPGLYLYHCHILEHEDMGMMRNLRILPNN